MSAAEISCAMLVAGGITPEAMQIAQFDELLIFDLPSRSADVPIV